MGRIDGTRFDVDGEAPRRASDRDFDRLRERRSKRLLSELADEPRKVRIGEAAPGDDPDFRLSEHQLESRFSRMLRAHVDRTFAASESRPRGRR